MQSLWLSCELELGETVSFADGLVCANAVFAHRAATPNVANPIYFP